MDWEARLAASSLEAGLVVERIGSNSFDWRRKLRKLSVMVEQSLDDLEVVGHVGPHVEQAAGLQDACDSVGKEIREETSAAMFSFPPRVGEVDVNRCQRSGKDQVVEQIVRIAADHMCVWLLTFEEPFRSTSAFGEVEFHAEEVSFRLCRAGVEQKHAASAANIQLDGMRIAEQFLPIQPAILREVRGEIVEAEKIGAEIDNVRDRVQLGSPPAASR